MILAGLILAFHTQLVHAAFLLFVVLFGMAGLFVLAGAEFLAVAQVIVYVGGILILIIFGVMLTQHDQLIASQAGWHRLPAGLLLSGAFAYLLLRNFGSIDLSPGQASDPLRPTVEQIGIETVTTYALPFELMSILLLVALVGAAYLARSLGQNSPEEDEPELD